jgi:hypothetical protein
MIDLDEIEARAKAATPGPWRADEDSEETGRGVTDDAVEHWIFFATNPAPSEADTAHIAGMDPQTTLALVAELRAAREFRDAVRSALAPGRWRGFDGPDGVSTHEVTADVATALEAYDRVVSP